MGYAEGTVSYRVKFDAAELINLSQYEGQTVTVVYSVDVVGTEYTIDLVKIDVEVPALPEGYLTGSDLAGLANPGHFDSTVDENGYVTFTGKTADNNIDLMPAVTGNPKYAVMKYKTTTAGSHATVYASSTSANGAIGGNVKINLTADGEWHVVAFALENSANYTVADGEAVTFLRLDVCESAPGTETLTIAYVQLCDSLEGINVDKNFQKHVDGEGVEGVDYTFNGWAGVDGYTLSGVTLYITDAAGNVTELPLENTNDESVALRWHERDDITTHLINNCGFSADTLGYAIRIAGPLTSWAEQTVTMTIKVTVSDGTVITVHESTQTVGAAPVEPAPSEPVVLVDATYASAVPEQLTYITNNENYPDPSFYGDGGLKMNYVNMGMQTVAFEAKASVKVTLVVNALNENTKSDNAEVDAYTFYGLDANGEVVATATLNTLVVGDNEVTLAGEGIVAVKVIMTDYYNNGNKCCNVSVGGLKVVG